ncbi:MAG: hypothetical protein U0Q16_02195 [Bryobacteraceae bacterium]
MAFAAQFLRGQTPEVFVAEERFGVNHPAQLIEFDSAGGDPGSAVMMGPNQEEVPFQAMSSGRIAVISDLPAGSQRVFQLVKGRQAKQFPGSVVLADQGDFYEISNGLTGVRIAKPDRDPKLAPSKASASANGWAATGPNYLYPSAPTSPPQTPRSPFGLHTLPRTRAPGRHHRSRLQIPPPRSGLRQQAPHPRWRWFLSLRVDRQAGQPSVTILDDTDMDLQYRLDLYGALPANQARYRGHLASRVESSAPLLRRHPLSGQRARCHP